MSLIAVTVDPTTGISEAEAQAACLAVDAQAREFATEHGIEYTPVVLFSWDVLEALEGDDLTKFMASARLLTVQADVGVKGVLGFHSSLLGVVFARVKSGPEWQVTLSHEVLEEMLNPPCDGWAPMADGGEQALEACDRVQGDTYRIGDVLVSNYLLPTAFAPDSAGPWDKLGSLTRWDGMSGGGYMITRSADGTRVNVFAETEHAQARANAKLELGTGRTARRLAMAAEDTGTRVPVLPPLVPVIEKWHIGDDGQPDFHAVEVQADEAVPAAPPKPPAPVPRGRGRGRGRARA